MGGSFWPVFSLRLGGVVWYNIHVEMGRLKVCDLLDRVWSDLR